MYPPAQVCTGVLSTCVCTCVDGEEGERGVKWDEIEEEGEKWLLATSPIFYPFCFFLCDYCVCRCVRTFRCAQVSHVPVCLPVLMGKKGKELKGVR